MTSQRQCTYWAERRPTLPAMSKEGKHFVAMMREATLAALEATNIEPRQVETSHGRQLRRRTVRQARSCRGVLH